jgi:hypothetical protein
LNNKGETSTAMAERSRSSDITVDGEEVRETVDAGTSPVDFSWLLWPG